MIQNIYHKCGHTRKLDMGLMSRNNRIRLAEDYGHASCPDCELKEIEKFENENGLPELEGSDKQIRWATKIRYVKLTGIHKDFWDKNLTEASVWIDGRNRFRQPRNNT